MDKQNLPRDIQFASYESSIERDKMVLAANKELLHKLDEVSENCRKELRAILGTKYDEYRSLRQKIRERALELHHLVKPTPEGEKIKREFDRTASAEMQKFISNLGKDFVTAKNVQKKFKTLADELVDKVLNTSSSPYVDVDAPALDDTQGPWTYRRPPYYDSSGLLARIRHGTLWYANESHYENATTGEIGSRALMQLRHEEEGSICSSYVRSDISVLYQLPVTGLVEVYAYLQCIDSFYNTFIMDEFGFSELRLYQRSRAYLEEAYPLSNGQPNLRRYATLLEINRNENDDDEYTSGEMAMPGGYLYPHLLSIHPYATGELVIMKVGVESYQYVKVNDYTCQGILNSKWFVSQVALRSTGNS
jgi:hypothetical protein